MGRVSTQLEVWQCELFQMEAENGDEQILGSWLVAGSSKGQNKVECGKGVAVLALSRGGQRQVAVEGEP